MKCKHGLIDSVSIYIETLHKTLEDIGGRKIKEIENMFNGYESLMKNIYSGISEAKDNINSFVEKNKDFLSISENKDVENTLFLICYEIANSCIYRNNEIKEVLDKVRDLYSNYQIDIKAKFEKISNTCEELSKEVFGKKHNSSINDFEFRSSIAENFVNASKKLNCQYYKEVKNKLNKYEEHLIFSNETSLRAISDIIH
jgi:phage-related protein